MSARKAFDSLTQSFISDFVTRYEDRNGAGSATDTVKDIIGQNLSYADNNKFSGCICATEIERWERLAKVFEAHANREGSTPLPGDRVLVKGKDGVVYENAVIEGFERLWNEDSRQAYDNKEIVNICVRPSVHVGYNQEVDLERGLNTSVSGGYFHHVPASSLVPLSEKKVSQIWFWGKSPCANGGLYMGAEFKYWLLEDEYFY